MYKQAGHCVFCGAPIYQVTDPDPQYEGDELALALTFPTEAPTAHFTCVCRAKHGLLPVGDTVVETTSVRDADRKFVEKMRPGESADGR